MLKFRYKAHHGLRQRFNHEGLSALAVSSDSIARLWQQKCIGLIEKMRESNDNEFSVHICH